MSRNRILIVDDEPAIREMVAVALELADFDVLEADNAQRAHEYIVDERPDLVLLDWMLPSVSGIELARRLKREDATAEVPIIMLTAKSEEDNKIQGLDVGADDYITKPFSTRELILRVHAVLRRGVPSVATVEEVDFGVLRVDLPAHRVWIEGVEVTLTALELRLLMALYNRRGRVQSRDQLLSEAWEDGIHVTERTVDTHVKRLRKKILVASQYIETIRGVGYRFLTEAPA